MTDWHGKPYYSLDAYCKNVYQHKLYKIALNAHLTCPNRDGTLDVRGCIFCSKGGSGEFSVPLCEGMAPDMEKQLADGLRLFGTKNVGEEFIAYFQAYTNTYGPLPYLESIYRSALDHPKIRGISIATRPDCVSADVVSLLQGLAKEYPEKFLWIELGLQTAQDETARRMNRGYPLSVFTDACRRLKEAGLTVIVHLIFGLPGESREDMLNTVRFVADLNPPVDGVKLQMLHVLKGTALGAQYAKDPFPLLTLEDYAGLVAESVRLLPKSTVLHRLTGDAPGPLLLAPEWTRNKKRVLNTIHRALKESEMQTQPEKQKTQLELSTADLLLRTLTLEDLEELARMWNYPEGVPLEEARTVLQDMEHNREKNRPNAIFHLCLAIVEKQAPKRIIGWCGLDGIAAPGQTVLFYIVEEGCRGRGYATQCAKELLRYAFEDMACERIAGGCAKDNLASKRVMEKAGMRLQSRTKHGGWNYTMDRATFLGLER